MDRRNFLQNTCPTITFAFFGISYIQACSKGNDSVDNSSSTFNNSTGDSTGDSTGGSTGSVSNGVSVNGNIITVDLSNATFSGLTSPGNYINLTANQLLILKISDNEYRAFDNCCPHSGVRNKWSFGDDKFTCGEHGNSFSVDGNDVKACGSGATSGGLKRYTASLNGEVLTITT